MQCMRDVTGHSVDILLNKQLGMELRSLFQRHGPNTAKNNNDNDTEGVNDELERVGEVVKVPIAVWDSMIETIEYI